MDRTDAVVLVVDDDSEDFELIKTACAEIKAPASLRQVDSVDGAIAYFEGRQPYADRAAHPHPGLVLLDLRLPVKDGFAFLVWLRGRAEGWRHVPVIVLTSGHDLTDVKKAYDLGANSFLVKPSGFDDLCAAMGQILPYWLERNRWA